MRKVLAVLALAVLLPTAAMAQDARTIVANASRAMGVDNLTSITYWGAGANFNVGQNSNASNPWPRQNLNDYRRTIDFAQPALRSTAVTWAAPPQGTPAAQGAFQQQVGPMTGWAQAVDIWISPWGFLKGAAANNATARTTGTGAARQHVVTWTPPTVKSPSGQQYRIVGYINATTNLVERVETWLDHNIFGDMLVETRYSGYREGTGGVKFPAEIVQNRQGWPAHQMWVQGAIANPPNAQALLTPPPPPAGRGGGPGGAPGGGGGQQAPQVASEQLAPGVYRITGGYVALAVEFSDHIFIFEAGPQSEARSTAILDEARRVIPNKPVRYGAISHHHADHTGGIANLVAEGVTIVMHEGNKAYFDRAFANPRTLLGDKMARANRRPVIETVGDMRVFQDATRRLELHVIKGLPHADGLLVAYLPNERILAYADMFTAPAPNAPAPTQANIVDVVMLDNLERLRLNYDTVISVHAPNPDRPLRRADIYAAVPGRTPPTGTN
jgi:glyoxylase-like metal-dependent hydrolase (beta-lactamase superfamily II)